MSEEKPTETDWAIRAQVWQPTQLEWFTAVALHGLLAADITATRLDPEMTTIKEAVLIAQKTIEELQLTEQPQT